MFRYKAMPLRGIVARRFGPEAGEDGEAGQVPPSGASQVQAPPAGKMYDEAYVKDLRDEAAQTRIKLKEFEDAKKKADDEAMTEAERLKKERDEAKQEAETLRREKRLSSIQSLATREGARYPDLVALKVPEDTKEADLVSAIKAVRKDYPELFAHVDADGAKKNAADADEKPTPGLGTLRAAYAEKEKAAEK
jgi:hypothetical protein